MRGTDMRRQGALSDFDQASVLGALLTGPAPPFTLHKGYKRSRQAGGDIQVSEIPSKAGVLTQSLAYDGQQTPTHARVLVEHSEELPLGKEQQMAVIESAGIAIPGLVVEK